jgi:hypothetical protein
MKICKPSGNTAPVQWYSLRGREAGIEFMISNFILEMEEDSFLASTFRQAGATFQKILRNKNINRQGYETCDVKQI